MIKILTLLLELSILALALWLGTRLCWNRYDGIKKGMSLVLVGCATLIAISVGQAVPRPARVLTLTALNKKSESSSETTVYLEGLRVDGKAVELQDPVSGRWTARDNGRPSWFAPGDKRREEGQTDSVTYQVEAGDKTELIFWENRWKGKVLIQIDDKQEVVDTCWDDGDNSHSGTVILPQPGAAITLKTVLSSALCFTLVLAVLCVVLTVLLELGSKAWVALSGRLFRQNFFHRLAGYQFLFEELVKRDFKKKYKRTVLGMAWSVLSPLLTLLVMRLVFTQFFGRQTAHYTTYLFCGNLVYSYFNESTSQGMTSLMSNAGIFTKVNVPKYLFLFSKNVQTLINFGLTLCVFFVFCVIDNITFTWKLVCLLYPICMLVLFNIGVGLILSALFVFFRDIQYLWSVFTMLLMYMSAIFYNIDGYAPMIRNLFLLNPVYLFIRYFRKIVIETTIPTIWFHLLMLADVVIVLVIGCWMYKKYNHRFLYYV